MTKFSDQNRNENENENDKKHFTIFLLKFRGLSGAKAKESCRSRKILKNAPLPAILAVDTAENEPLKV